MYCPKCGANLADGIRFCPKCGNPVKQTGQQIQGKTNLQLPNQAPPNSEQTKCPMCGSNHCEIQVQQNIKGSGVGGGYSCMSAGCGYLWAGPFGLLCGLCGTGSRMRISTSHQSMWVCKSCGHQFMPRATAVKTLMQGAFVSGFALTFCVIFLLSILGQVLESSSNIEDGIFLIVAIIVFYYVVTRGIRQVIRQQGTQTVQEFLTKEEYNQYKKRRWLGMLAAIGVMVVMVLPAIID